MWNMKWPDQAMNEDVENEIGEMVASYRRTA